MENNQELNNTSKDPKKHPTIVLIGGDQDLEISNQNNGCENELASNFHTAKLTNSIWWYSSDDLEWKECNEDTLPYCVEKPSPENSPVEVDIINANLVESRSWE